MYWAGAGTGTGASEIGIGASGAGLSGDLTLLGIRVHFLRFADCSGLLELTILGAMFL